MILPSTSVFYTKHDPPFLLRDTPPRLRVQIPCCSLLDPNLNLCLMLTPEFLCLQSGHRYVCARIWGPYAALSNLQYDLPYFPTEFNFVSCDSFMNNVSFQQHIFYAYHFYKCFSSRDLFCQLVLVPKKHDFLRD